MPSLETFRLRQLNPAVLATERRAHIPQQFSLFIHLWRILAVAAVFVGHATKPDILFDVDVAILGRAKRWGLKRRQKDLTLVLQRPVEATPQTERKQRQAETTAYDPKRTLRLIVLT